MVHDSQAYREALDWAFHAPVGSPLERCVLVDMVRVGAYWPNRLAWCPTELGTQDFCGASVSEISGAVDRLQYVWQYICERNGDNLAVGSPGFCLILPSQLVGAG
jgi:hypothetical protein